MRKFRASAVFVVSMMMLAGRVVRADTIPVANASFETLGSATGGQWYGLPDPGTNTVGYWIDSHAGYGGYEIDGAGDNFTNAADGTHYFNMQAAELPAGENLDQDLATTVSAGASITMTFDAGVDKAGAGGSITAEVLVGEVVEGTTTVTLAGGSSQANTWYPESVTAPFVPAQGDVSIEFFEPDTTSNLFLDNVAVTQIPLPEPASMGAVGIAALCLFRRRSGITIAIEQNNQPYKRN